LKLPDRHPPVQINKFDVAWDRHVYFFVRPTFFLRERDQTHKNPLAKNELSSVASTQSDFFRAAAQNSTFGPPANFSRATPAFVADDKSCQSVGGQNLSVNRRAQTKSGGIEEAFMR